MMKIPCPGCDGDGWNYPYGPNGYEAKEVCTVCKGLKTIDVEVDSHDAG